MTTLPSSHLTFSALKTGPDLWLFINLSAAADIHHLLLLRACHTHTQTHGSWGYPGGAFRLTHCLKSGEIALKCMKDETLYIVFISSGHSYVSTLFLQEIYENIKNADASEWPISGLSGAPILGRLWIHIIHFSWYSPFQIKNKSQNQLLGTRANLLLAFCGK